MKIKVKKVLKRRFEGFTDEWEERKIEDLFKVTRGYVLAATKTSSGKTEAKPYPVYSSQTANQGLLGYYKDYLYEDAITWTTDGANAGTVNYREGKFYCTNVCGVLLSEEGYANKMVSEALDMVAWKHVSLVGNPKLMNNVMSEIEIYLPESMEEQKKIGSFFNQLDKLISLHQNKLNKLEDLKKAYLSEMFPQEGEKVPRRRFKGFTDNWEQRKLGEVGEFNPKSDIPERFKYVDLESVIGTELVEYREENKISAPSRAQRLAQQGDLFYQTVRPYQKNNFLFDKPDKNYVFSTGYAQIRPSIDGNFLLNLVQNELFVKLVLDRCTGTSYPAINANDLIDIEVVLPTKIEEQKKIGSFFKQLDSIITLHQRKLNKLEDLKKAYLSEMFV